MRRCLRCFGPTAAAIFAAGILFAAARALTSPDPLSRTPELITDMVHSPAYKSQSVNPNFDDGMTERVPPPGTIARGFEPIDSTTLAEMTAESECLRGADSAARTAMLARAIGRGDTVFHNICVPCHGAGALGDGPVTRRGFPPPPSLLAANAIHLSDGAIYRIISDGRGNMPSLAPQVDRADRWKVIAYIRSIQPKVDTTAGPPKGTPR